MSPKKKVNSESVQAEQMMPEVAHEKVEERETKTTKRAAKKEKETEIPEKKVRETKGKAGKARHAREKNVYKNVSGSTIDPTKILFATYERKMQAREKVKTPAELATENLKKALAPGRNVIFKGIVVGKSSRIDENGKKVYFLHVNTDCNVPGYKGRLVRIRIDDFVAPLCTKDRPKTEFDPKTSTEYDIINYISSRQGSQVEFCVTDMDMKQPDTGFIIGSRIPALEKRRSTFWYGQTNMRGTQDKRFVIENGSIVDAKIVAVLYTGVFFEAQGLEGYIPIRELTHREVDNAKDHFSTDQYINIMISELERNNQGKIYFKASHKATYPNPAPAFMAQYMPGDEITNVVIKKAYYNEKTRETIYYGDVENKFSIRLKMARGREKDPIKGDKVNVLVKGKDVDMENNTGQIWGDILHVYSDYK